VFFFILKIYPCTDVSEYKVSTRNFKKGFIMKTLLITFCALTLNAAIAIAGPTVSVRSTTQAPLLNRVYSPGMPMADGRDYIVRECTVFEDHVIQFTFDLLANVSSEVSKSVIVDSEQIKKLSLVAQSVETAFGVGETDAEGVEYYAYSEDGSRLPLKISGRFNGENTSAAAQSLIKQIDLICGK
jgi:hypothetical protein